MDLEFSDEQELLRATLRGLLSEQSAPDDVRALEDDPVGYRPALWRGLADLDLLGLTVPEEHGGSGMGTLELVVVHEELGRALASVPHLTTCVVGAGLLVEGGDDTHRRAWLPRIASGDAILSLAWHEAGRSEGAPGIQLRADRNGDGFVLTGSKIRVPHASSAHAILTLARAEHGIVLLLVDPGAPGVTLTHTETLSGEAEYEVGFDQVEVPASARVGDDGWALFEQVLPDALIAVAANAIGGAERALELTVAYAKQREQFGKPIGSFQGLAHPIADVATELTSARVLVHQAAWARAQGRELGPLAHVAKYYACDVYKRVTKVGQQVFGGIGFTRVIDIQLYFRRAKQLELTWLGPAPLEEVVAAAELDRNEVADKG